MVAAAPPATSPVLVAIAFWDARRGLLGTRNCELSAQCGAGTVELTTDGGRRWRVVLRTRRPVLALETAGRDGAIAATGGGAFHTLDGGRHWRRYRLRFAASFATPLVGLAARGSVVDRHLALAVVATRDGGRSWERRTSPCNRAVADSALLDLVTDRLGWIVCLGQPGAGNEEKAVFRTRDGGRSWQAGAAAIASPRPQLHGGLSGYGYPEGIAFARDGFGILWESRGTLYVTRDGGARWTAEPAVARPEIDFGRGAAAFPGGHGLVLLGDGGGRPTRLLATDDYGRSWHIVRRWG
ncbi:MAG TPA: hypothetical protein VFA19_04680 [Gaiellaceae bacterium]|nr:hypothetical protein [Gaiellaceae bacterium]